MVVPLPCFVKPKTLPFPKAEVAFLAKTSEKNIVKVHHWRYAGWVERAGCQPITISYRCLSTWLPTLRRVIFHCKSWRRFCQLVESLEADFIKYPNIYLPHIQQQLRGMCARRRAQLQAKKPRQLFAENLTAAYEEIIKAAVICNCLDGLEVAICQHDALWKRYPQLRERLERAWEERRTYLHNCKAA